MKDGRRGGQVQEGLPTEALPRRDAVVMAVLLRLAAEGELITSDRIEAMTDLSHTTVHNALHDLTELGLIDRAPKRGDLMYPNVAVVIPTVDASDLAR